MSSGPRSREGLSSVCANKWLSADIMCLVRQVTSVKCVLTSRNSTRMLRQGGIHAFKKNKNKKHTKRSKHFLISNYFIKQFPTNKFVRHRISSCTLGNTVLLSSWRSLRIKLHDWYLLFCRVSTMTIRVSIKECAVRLIMLCYVITHATNSAHAAYSWPLGITHARAHCSLSWGADRVYLLLLMAAEEPERGMQMLYSVNVKC